MTCYINTMPRKTQFSSSLKGSKQESTETKNEATRDRRLVRGDLLVPMKANGERITTKQDEHIRIDPDYAVTS